MAVQFSMILHIYNYCHLAMNDHICKLLYLLSKGKSMQLFGALLDIQIIGAGVPWFQSLQS